MIKKTLLPIFACLCFATAAQADLVLNIGSATVDVSSRSGIAIASIDVFLENNGVVAENAFGYTLLYDLDPVSPLSLPLGITIPENNAVVSGNVFPGTIGLTVNSTAPANGDIAIAENQFSAVEFSPGESRLLHTINFQVDRSVAVEGDYQLVLNTAGNSDGIADSILTTYDPIASAGTLSITVTAIPEPSSCLFMAGLGGVVVSARRRRRS
ncbi:PEP-CTERM sorting domain-containing protein [Roseiconus lacunae]|uniref:PEP-CTERM sorting domain-containing protein n=1 Tax=Roseiconus lacunae TaxID=2605694 RepID=UPI00308CD9F6|nr:PEP-CTERM sorting domain-containing protein [Stieleria sp. HD01]